MSCWVLDLTWISEMLLFVFVLGFGFTGYLLPWNTLALFATKVGSETAGSLPAFGKGLLVLLRDGELMDSIDYAARGSAALCARTLRSLHFIR